MRHLQQPHCCFEWSWATTRTPRDTNQTICDTQIRILSALFVGSCAHIKQDLGQTTSVPLVPLTRHTKDILSRERNLCERLSGRLLCARSPRQTPSGNVSEINQQDTQANGLAAAARTKVKCHLDGRARAIYFALFAVAAALAWSLSRELAIVV